MRSFAFAAVAAAALATPALAQDAATFTGLRAEGIVGWDRSQAYDGHDDGAVYGFGLGYDIQRGSALIGLEGEISDSTTKECAGAGSALDPELCAKAGRDFYVGGRVGAVVGSNTLLYVKVGYTNARYKVTFDDGTGSESDGANFDGLRMGGGAEYAIGPNSFVKAEYRYSNYEDGISRHQVVGGFGFRF